MQSDDPPFLSVGIDVSAKFKGAFCEAKVKKVQKSVKCKVSYKDAPFGSALVDDTQIKGNLELNAIVDVIHGKGTTIRAVINHIKDCSLYTVGEYVPNLQINRHLSEFNDGDERNLRRTQLCLKGGKHFDAEHNLDALPLYNPEQFGNPVHATSSSVGVGSKTANQSIKRWHSHRRDRFHCRQSAAPVDDDEEKLMNSDGGGGGNIICQRRGGRNNNTAPIDDDDDDSSATTDDHAPTIGRGHNESASIDTVVTSSSTRKAPSPKARKKDDDFGRAVCVYDDATHKGRWYPAITASPFAHKLGKTCGRNDALVRSFKDGKFTVVPNSHLLTLDSVEAKQRFEQLPASGLLKQAAEKAYHFIDRNELPSHWDRDMLFGRRHRNNSSDIDRKSKKSIAKSSQHQSSSDDSYSEEEYSGDRFVAQLYKFQDERGTPINKAPVLGGKDIDLYRFYKIVHKFGGYNRVCNNNAWKQVLIKMRLAGCSGATPLTVKNAYCRYLSHFNSMYRRLGWQMDESSASTSTSSRASRQIRNAGKNRVKLKTKKTHTTVASIAPTTMPAEIASAPATSDKEKSDKDGGREKIAIAKEQSESDHHREKDAHARGSKETKVSVNKQSRVKDAPRCRANSGGLTMEKRALSTGPASVELNQQPPAYSSASSTTSSTSSSRNNHRHVDEMPNNGSSGGEQHREFGRKVDVMLRSSSAIGGDRHRRKSESKADGGCSPSGDEDGGPPTKRHRHSATDDEQTPNDDDGYHRGSTASRFYIGQKVRAQHHGSWYEARVLQLDEETSRPSPTGALSTVVGNSFRPIIKRCFVHYQGWNARYDEWVVPSKIRVSNSDRHPDAIRKSSVSTGDDTSVAKPTMQQSSSSLMHNSDQSRRGTAADSSDASSSADSAIAAANRLKRKRLLNHPTNSGAPLPIPSGPPLDESARQSPVIRKLAAARQQNEKICEDVVDDDDDDERDDDASNSDSSIVANRSSIKQQPTSGTAPVLRGRRKRVNQRPVETPSPDTAPPSPELLPGALSFESTMLLKSGCDRVSCNRPDSEDDTICSQKSLVLDRKLSIDVVSSIATDDISVSTIITDSKPSVNTFDSKAATIGASLTSSSIDSLSTIDADPENDKIDHKSLTAVTVDNDLAKTEDDDDDMVDDGDDEDDEMDEEMTEPAITSRIDDGRKDSTNGNMMIAINDNESFAFDETIGGGDGGGGSETPAYGDDDGDDSHTAGIGTTPNSASRSPSRKFSRGGGAAGGGSGTKRRRHRNYSHMVTDGRKHSKCPSGNRVKDEDSDDGGCGSMANDTNDCASPKDSLSTLKAKIQQKMEAENDWVCEDVSFPPIDSSLSGDRLISALQERIQDVRDTYHQTKTELASLERRWRRTVERRKIRERESKRKEMSATLASPIHAGHSANSCTTTVDDATIATTISSNRNDDDRSSSFVA